MLSEKDQERFMRLWTDAQPAVANYVHALMRDHTAAKDVLQETALVVFRKFGEYDGERPFVAWALGMAKFQVMGWHRDHGRSRLVFDEAVVEGITAQWAELAPSVSDREVALQTCMEKLTARARQMVRWRYYEDQTAEQIGKRLQTPGPTVRVTLQRIREQLRDCVERQTEMKGNPL